MTRLLPLACLFSCLAAVPLSAQGLLIGPSPTSDVSVNGPSTQPVPNRPAHGRRSVHIASTKVQARIVDGVATTTIDQVIANTTRRDAEGTWFLPLPAGAIADGFTMSVGGKEIRGEVLDAGQARSVYQSIVRRRRDPGLLEYAGEGLLRARIFPIPANGEVGVTVRIRQVLEPRGGMYEWSWPVKASQLGDASAAPIGVDVQIESRTPLASVVTPHASAEIRRDGEHKARVSLEGANGDFDDLHVLYGLTKQEFGLHLLAYRTQPDPGYFTMLVSPPRTLATERVPPRLVQLVVDTSGSMKGAKIEQAKASLHAFLQSLRPQDHFQVLPFSSSVQPFFDGPIAATAKNVEIARKRVETLRAMGGTNIGEALRQALEADAPHDGDTALLQQIVFITDGEPTVGLTKPKQILDLCKQSDRSKTRVFALGVGDRIDVRLLDDLVLQHRGARDFVGSREKIETKVDALCQKISQPALTDVVVKCGELDSFDVHPTRTRDLFCGETLQVVGRYRDHGMRTVRICGKQNGREREFVFDVEFPKKDLRHAFVQTLWARQHVAGLLDAIRRNGVKQELVSEVRALATRYGIVTPYTSQLIVEESERLAGRPVRSVRRDRGIRYGGLGTAPRSGRSSGVSIGGPSSPVHDGPHGPVPSGPATGGPAGPASPGPTGPVAGGAGGRGAPIGGRALPSSRGPGGSAGTAHGGNYTGPGDAVPPSIRELGRARTGKAAVAESKAVSGSDDFYLGARGRLKGGEKDARKSSVRRAAGRVFLRIGDDLVEQGLPKDWQKQAVKIESFSTAYFELLKQQPQLRAILALGDRVVFREGKRIVQVKPVVEPEAKPKADDKSGGAAAVKKAAKPAVPSKGKSAPVVRDH